jgi:hypothetical protein
MDEKPYSGVSWTTLFFVTACSSFIFCLILKVLNGNISGLFLKLGVTTGVLGLCSWGISWLLNKMNAPKKEKSVIQVEKSRY